jgi:CubicO group peptidase (beta-lactamase class C family)
VIARFRPGKQVRSAVARAAAQAGLLLIVHALGSQALAQPASVSRPSAQIAASFDVAITSWMAQYRIPAASLAVMNNGRIVTTLGYGGMDANTRGHIASLSKAITAVCIGRLVDAGRLSFTATLGAVLQRAFQTLGEPRDPGFKSITIEQLLMHRAGLAREPVHGPPARDLADNFRRTLATPLAGQPGTTMSYSNIGYLTLGVVVESITAVDYETYCRDAALTPMKAAGSIDPSLRMRAPNGGWLVSAVDYAKFYQVFDRGPSGLGPISRAWLDARHETPTYGLGVEMNRSQGLMLYHGGRVALSERGGAYAIKFPTGWTTVVEFDGDLSREGYADLRRHLQTVVAGL